MTLIEISAKTNGKAGLQAFSMLLEINRKRLLKLKCQSMMALSKVNFICCSSYLTGEVEDLNETYCR
jgi:hypothetical protein